MIFAIPFFVFSVSAEAQSGPAPFAQSFQSQQSGRQDADYQKGLRALDARQWDEAVDDFSASASHKGATADAALYWKAYAMNRAGRREDALDTISDLKEAYPSSRWIKDAKALELEVRAATGAPVNAGTYSDDDLKLLAVNSLMQSEPEKALPVLQKLLASNNSDKIKDRALFVLAQNPSPEARKTAGSSARKKRIFSPIDLMAEIVIAALANILVVELGAHSTFNGPRKCWVTPRAKLLRSGRRGWLTRFNETRASMLLIWAVHWPRHAVAP